MSARDEQADLAILAQAFFEHIQVDRTAYGAIGLDTKRFFGSRDFEADILRMLGLRPEGAGDEAGSWSQAQRDYVCTLYFEKLIPYLRSQWARFTAAPAKS